MSGTRDRMVLAAAGLFRDQGYDGTGFREVVEVAGTTPGVIYHHFPGGKTDLGVAVALAVGEWVAAGVEAACAALPPRDAVSGLLDAVEGNLLRGELRPGCPIVAIAFASDDDDGRLRAASDAFFTRIRTALSECLVRDGVDRVDAEAFAALAVSASEGAIFLSRARRHSEPFDATRRALIDQVNRLTKETTA
ncbi:MAG: TetR/AcrR family transcriptional regulator [Actinomycetales bacterium]|nr:TetR/AcrR family transcriptional regulator [Actinomycetales bacterium]